MVASAVLVLGLSGAAAAPADEGDTRVVLKYRLTSNELVGGQRFITLAGSGNSPDLGRVEATSSVVVNPVQGGCNPRTSDDVWSTASGTLEVHSEGEVCKGRVSGIWEVTGGSGDFAGASGGGVMTIVGSGRNLVARYEGEISR